MTISKVESAATVGYVAPAGNVSTSPSSQTSGASSDRVEISSEGAYAAQLTQQVASMAPVRSDVVAQFKGDVAKGTYPPQDIIAGFMRMMGINPSQGDSNK